MASSPRSLTEPKTQKQQERRWAAESALSTLTRAAEHKKNPTLMRDVKALAREQVRTLSSVTGRGKGK